MDTININGIEYVKKSDAAAAYTESDHVCVIADRGWIFEGRRVPGDDDVCSYDIRLADAHVVRCWDNGLGIGGLAKVEHKDDYTLDDLGCAKVAGRAVIAVIPLEW